MKQNRKIVDNEIFMMGKRWAQDVKSKMFHFMKYDN